MIDFKEALEALERVKNNLEHHYPENIRDLSILKQALEKAFGMEKELDFLKFLFCAKILPAAKMYIDEEAQMFNLSFTFKKDSEAYNLLKELLEDD